MANTTLSADPTLFFLIKNLIMILNDVRRILLIYVEVKETKAKVAETIQNIDKHEEING